MHEVISIHDPNDVYSKQPQVTMWFTGSGYYMQIHWTQGNDLTPNQFHSSFDTDMVNGGSYDITIRVKSRNIKVYIDGCLKSEGGIDFIEPHYQPNYPDNETPRPMSFINGVLSNIKYLAIGDSCSSRLVFEHSTDLYDNSDNGICECSDGFTGATCQEEWTEEQWTEHRVCQNVDCASHFDRCANFDETECSVCGHNFQHPEDVVLTDRDSPLSFPLDSVHKRCNNLRINFLLTTDAEFSTSTEYRTIFKLSKTTSSSVPDDARPAISISPDTNRILFSNSPFMQSQNRFAIADWWLWGIGNPQGFGVESSTSTGEIILGDEDFVIESNKMYVFSIGWQQHRLLPQETEVILSIFEQFEQYDVYDSNSPTEAPTTVPYYQARIDFSYGDYLCEHYTDMLAVFGQHGENSAVTFSEFEVYGLCSIPEEPQERKLCCN